jgi:hypothetical protein
MRPVQRRISFLTPQNTPVLWGPLCDPVLGTYIEDIYHALPTAIDQTLTGITYNYHVELANFINNRSSRTHDQNTRDAFLENHERLGLRTHYSPARIKYSGPTRVFNLGRQHRTYTALANSTPEDIYKTVSHGWNKASPDTIINNTRNAVTAVDWLYEATDITPVNPDDIGSGDPIDGTHYNHMRTAPN